jgi:AAA+ ATPase superfamily predicted ATPase
MMHSLFLDSRSPLYERANVILHLPPLTYKNYCQALGLDLFENSNFENFSIVGGVPKYWEFLDIKATAIENATNLFFESSARLENEPDRLLKDENKNVTKSFYCCDNIDYLNGKKASNSLTK